MTIAPVLTIAGSDSSGGAGVQADLKTMTMLGCFGMSAITALTAQNTLGVQGICPVPAEFLKQQIAAVCEDIPPAAVKVGMVYDTPQILAIAEAVAQYQLPHVVVDPVMVATSGDPLLKQQAQQALTEQLFPLAELLTPNLPEAEQLTGTSITSPPQMEQAARQLSETYHTAVLLKGGHSMGSCNDLLYAAGHCHVVFRTADRMPQTLTVPAAPCPRRLHLFWHRGLRWKKVSAAERRISAVPLRQACRWDTDTDRLHITMQF